VKTTQSQRLQRTPDWETLHCHVVVQES